MARIDRREDVSEADRERALEEYGDVEYADEKNKKYPLDSEAHIRSAWNYIHQAQNRAKYEPDEVAAIERKIVAAWKKKIDEEGPPAVAKKSAGDEGDVAVTEAEKALAALAVKALYENRDGVIVGGYAALWGSPQERDLQRDYFTPETELMLEHYKSAPALFHHGLDAKVGPAAIGHRTAARTDEVGVWVESWLDKSNEFWKMVEPLLRKGKLYRSPGSAPHMVKRAEDQRLIAFPMVEDSLTPTPAQHRLLPVEQIKAMYKAVNIDWPDEAAEAAGAGATDAEALRLAADVELLLGELE